MTTRPDCRVALRQCVAIVVRKEGCQGDPGDFWMYESGYLLFQGLLSANSVCWWNSALNGATKTLVYKGYVSPGAILVGSEPCALEILRGAWARRVLQPPAGYQIVSLEDVENSVVNAVPQTQWTPLTEAICAVVLRLSSQGRPAGIPTIREALIMAFPHVSPPSERVIYDTLVQLTTERKLYHTSRGYFIVTPERRRSRSHSRSRRRNEEETPGKGILMTTEEALVLVHGEMTTIRDGDVTHQCIQTNLADVICGGNASDKILFARNNKRRSASFPSPKSPDRRGSFRLWGSTRRLRRSASTRTIARQNYTDSSSSTEYPNSDSANTPTPKKESLLSRIFRRSKRSQCQISSFSAQFPPTEWFNSKAIHLHNVGTQTSTADEDSTLSLPYYFVNSETASSKSATLPRRHRRQLSNDSTYMTSHIASREQSPSLRMGTPSSSSLPRNPNRSPIHSIKSRESSRKTSRSSLTKVPPNDDIDEEEIKSLETKPIRPTKRDSYKIFGNDFKSPKASSLESLKTVHDDSTLKTLASLDNSGPSSIESHKSSKTGSSITSGPSSLESHKTVISRNTSMQQTSAEFNKCKRSPKRREKEKHKIIESQSHSPAISHSNSFTLQVTTNQNGNNFATSGTNATTTTTINSGTGANTKIYVQNSPVRSVITFENGQNNDPNPNLVIINGSDPIIEPARYQISAAKATAHSADLWAKNTNNAKEESLNNSTSCESKNPDDKNEQMNNSRKLSLQMPSRDLNYKNLLKNVPSTSNNKQFASNSNPDSPINNSFKEFTKNTFDSKSFDDLGGSVGDVYKQLTDSKTSLDKSYQSILEKNILGSEPNISLKDQEAKSVSRQNSHHHFPSLSDLSFNFTSLAAQKILKGVSINSIDTLVELNMAANGEKQNNCDIVHTDFGLV